MILNNSKALLTLLTFGCFVALGTDALAASAPRGRAFLLGGSTGDARHVQALENAGFQVVVNGSSENDNDIDATCYRYNRATGMLQRVSSSSGTSSSTAAVLPPPPAWIPLDRPQENLLVSKGWSFLDVDESEPQSSFDVDAANLEGTYRPKWGTRGPRQDNEDDVWQLSSLGWDVTPMSKEQVKRAVDQHVFSDDTKQVLLQGGTDPPNVKRTNNGYDLTGATSEIPPGLFTFAVTGVPLFTTTDLMPTTASSGWLSFARSFGKQEHLRHIRPDKESMDRRVEVVETKSGCHLGHWFEGDGYCINASCLDFFPLPARDAQGYHYFRGPSSYRSYQQLVHAMGDIPSWRLLDQAMQDYATVTCSTVVLGAGCFWHVESALRRLPGVVETTVGYAGGQTMHPTYEQVSSRETTTGHAEVVQVVFDRNILSIRQLVDCFLALHDPTKVRAHGKHAPLTGQNRSCVFVTDAKRMMPVVEAAIADCQKSLGKEVCTQIETGVRFWPAEERHQRYEERREDSITETHTLSTADWLDRYGRRAKSVMGTAHTLEKSIAESRFYT